MSEIVGIGACVADTLITLPRYPDEDTKMRAVSTKIAGGGPTSTGIVAASKLGAKAEYVGVLSDDGAGDFLLSDFKKYGVGVENVARKSGYRSFTSVIWLSLESASRTCVFDKGDLPPLELTERQLKAITSAKLLMVDGNELEAAIEGAKCAHENGALVLYDCGGLYPNVERLLALTDIMIPSEEFAIGHTKKENVGEAAKALYATYHPRVVVVTRGKLGGVIFDGKTLEEYPAFLVDAVDTNGSGDVFHGAFAAAVIRGYDYRKCCIFASATSAIKCTGVGARESTPDFDTVKTFLKEKGYEL